MQRNKSLTRTISRPWACAWLALVAINLLNFSTVHGDELDIRRFTPAAIKRLCPDHVGGDREFKGHGPDVTARATLSIRGGSKEVWVSLYLHAKETRSNWTEAEGGWERKLWTAPEGFVIDRFATDRASEATHRDTDHQLDRPAVRGGALVESFEIMGDTGGNDVGNCTADDVYMNVYFNEVRVVLRPQ